MSDLKTKEDYVNAILQDERFKLVVGMSKDEKEKQMIIDTVSQMVSTMTGAMLSNFQKIRENKEILNDEKKLREIDESLITKDSNKK